jgi:glycogen synthase kinase 3 beta
MESISNDDKEKTKITEKDLKFEKNDSIGSGAFGEVFLAKIISTKEKVAVKKVFQDKRYKNRELSIMKELDHPNLIFLKSYYYTKAPNHSDDEFYLNVVMDYVPQTLSSLISHNRNHETKFPDILLKIFSFQMLKGIGYLQSLGICHRDIKPQNILINPDDFTLKICDFGCAKHLIKGEPNIAYICSRYFRPPELVLGCTEYTTQVDVWSIGCVIAELCLDRPIFPGKSAKEQLYEIMKILGTPTKEELTNMNGKYKNLKLPKINAKPWATVFKNKNNDPLYIDLVSKLHVYEPESRLTPYKALCHPYFDDLRKSDVKLPNGKPLPSHIFKFKQSEIDCDKESIEFLLAQME